jgi:hypothetical protein
MYDNSTSTRNYLGGLARGAGLSEPAIARFIDVVREFRLHGPTLIAAMEAGDVADVDLFGISRISQDPRAATLEHGDGRAHGRTITWTVRLYTRSPHKVINSFPDGAGGAEKALVSAIKYRDLNLRTPHTARGPYHPKRRRPIPAGHEA